MRRDLKSSLKSFLVELLVYGALVAAYYFLVLEFCGGWLAHLFQHERKTYAVVALLLIVGQGIGLEVLTRGLLGFIRPRTGDE